ncbi:hypothetical protein [Hymenobacter glacieicola]|uniref:Lipoprotein n=1 Tax=Hymenobacter glacieicola TaxID=1562124 RepID=A0ABQ1WI94_9BACT|nr:hypothetical protein [Hymenobacter glacieicola]GGG31426.1 hypothetical protein GCM10011378_05010 [Hymenobacter glacieicola]
MAATSLTACTKDEVAPDTLVFGQFYGECAGERCIEIYQLTPRARTLAEDTQDKYPSFTSPYQGQFVARSATDYAKVSDLPDLIPAKLLAESAHVIGQPDAGDWGGYYVELNDHGTRRFWLIDTQKQNIPAYLHPLVDTLQSRIAQLQ